MKRFAILLCVGLGVVCWTNSSRAAPADPASAAAGQPQATNATSTASSAAEFLTDFEQAKKTAAKLKRPIFALFTGSDWCPWCKQLAAEVLTTDLFREYAAANLVLFEADFPRQTQLAEELRKQNAALAERYGIAGFPTVLLLDATGAVQGTTGYRPGGAAKYVGEVAQLLAAGPEALAAGEPMTCGFSVKQRLDYQNIAPGGIAAMLGLEKYVRQSGLEHSLLELIRARVSQINGCAYCVDMHTKDARANAESEQRLFLLAVWREAPCYTDRERAALAWAEELTVISQHEVSDKLFTEVRRYFTDKELVDLTYAIIAINGWNRLAISARAPVGTYQPSAAGSDSTAAK